MTGPIYAALSCLQGRRADVAAIDLLAAGVDGIQLTAGCAPAGDIAGLVADTGALTRTHHGYSVAALRARVWGDDGLVTAADSIHPPKARHAERFWAAYDAGALAGIAIETMWGPYLFGDTAGLRDAMAVGLDLAVDVSHLHIGVCAGAIDDTVLAELADYDHITEVHLSANDGRRDNHQRPGRDTFGLDWIRERHHDGCPVVVECYMHHMTPGDRRDVIDLIAGDLT